MELSQKKIIIIANLAKYGSALRRWYGSYNIFLNNKSDDWIILYVSELKRIFAGAAKLIMCGSQGGGELRNVYFLTCPGNLSIGPYEIQSV